MTDSAWVKQLGMPAVAGSLAACFTHPLELTKIRLQLDNELAQVEFFKSCQHFLTAAFFLGHSSIQTRTSPPLYFQARYTSEVFRLGGLRP